VKINRKIAATIAALTLSAVALTGCSNYTAAQERKDKQNAVTLDNSLGIENQKERLAREEDPNAIRYVYLMSFGNIIGYYTIQGKVSPAGTQLAPEQEIIYSGGNGNVVDSSKDDGTFGASDEGSFFFTTEGVLIETTLDYIQSDAPIALDVPRFNDQ
jgi:hypothetical protein